MMDNVEKTIEKCLDDIKREMRCLVNNHTKEFRITINKIGNLRFCLMKLYNKGFEQGVYAVK